MMYTGHELLARFLGEYCCRNDVQLTLAGDTSGLARFLGYTREEIASVYQNSLAAMIPEDARYQLQNALAEQLAEV